MISCVKLPHQEDGQIYTTNIAKKKEKFTN